MLTVRKQLSLIHKPNIVNISPATIYRDSLSYNDVQEMIKKINDSPLKIKDRTLFNFFMKYFKPMSTFLLSGENVEYERIHFIFSTELSLPAYFNINTKSFLCNFTRPISYLNADDLVAHLLYTFVYKLQLTSKQFKRNILLTIISDVFTSVILLLFGKREGLLSDYDSLAILKLITYKFVDSYFFNNHNYKLEDYTKYLNKFIVRNTTFDKSQLRRYDQFIDVSNFSSYIESLRKLDVLQNVDVKIIISTIYRRYGILPLTIFETPDRILPFLIILNFPNILNNNFATLVNNKTLESATKYVYLQYSSV